MSDKQNTGNRVPDLNNRLAYYREQSPVATIEWDAGRTVLDWNNSACRLFGYSRDEAIGQPIEKLVAGNGSLDEFVTRCRGLLEDNDNSRFTLDSVNRQGRRVVCEWFNTPLLNDAGQTVAVASEIVDITTKDNFEKALRQSQRVEVIRQLTGGIAHDFNNKLAIIIGYLEFLGKQINQDDRSSEWVGIAEGAALECAQLARRLLNFSYPGNETDPVDISLADVIGDMQRVMERLLSPAIELVCRFTDELWQTRIVPEEFQVVFLDLVISARDAMPDGGTLTVTADNVVLGSTNKYRLAAGRYVELLLNDSGTDAVPDEPGTQSDIRFDAGRAQMISGLAMVERFVNRLQGALSVESKQGKGTTLRLLFREQQGTGAAGDKSAVTRTD